MAAGPRKLTELEKVIRSFVRDGRLVSIPAKPSKRELLLPWLLDECFPEDRDYEEKEINQRLALWYPDVSALRRYLIDAGLMTRDQGIYRRAAPLSPDRPRPDPWPEASAAP
ncbi:MAG TPA: DUF2087 domain-containing protein [Candidatus Limnocylindrales bacterium]|nr:DUF2087 domain-containing protein [Candidatus Limnocylindrales bacterium]